MTETSFTLKWQPPDSDGGSPILEYLLERREAGKKAWQKVISKSHYTLDILLIILNYLIQSIFTSSGWHYFWGSYIH